MADYTPLLTRAVTGQDEAARQGIYARARDALERQLRGFEPALEEAHILTELEGLEHAIRTVEASVVGVPEAPATEAEAEVATPEPATPEPANPVSTTPAEAEAAPDAEGVETAGEPEATPPAQAEAAEAEAPEAPEDLETLNDPETLKDPESPEDTVPPGESPDEASVLTRDSTEDVTAPPMIEPVIPPTERPRMPLRHEASTSRKPLILGSMAALVVMLAIGAVAITRRNTSDPLRAPQAPAQAASVDSAKTEGRLASEPAKPAEAPQQAAPEAPTSAPATQEGALSTSTRAFMVMENPGNAPSQYEGAAIWSFEPDPASKGQRVVRTLIAFPGAEMTLDFALSRNTDAKLGASHLLMAIFELPKGAEPVRELSPIEWREREATQGSVLRGAVVPVQDNVFMVTLDKAAEANNLDLLLRQKWAVFEFRLANGRRGAALVEKGSTGDRAVAEAITTWK